MATFTTVGENDPLVKVDLRRGESVWSESDAMVMMDNTLDGVFQRSWTPVSG